LLDAAGLSGADRDQIESGWRREYARLPSGVDIRDQRPMPPSALDRCLVGMTAAEWYRLINGRVFFWFDHERLNRQRRACVARSQLVLVIDLERLVARHASRIALTPINSGSAYREPAPRGRATFVPYQTWMESRWSTEEVGLGRKPRQHSPRPVELTVLGAVRDVADMLVRVVPLAPSQLFNPATVGESRTAVTAP
jgi:hypothetical protein